MRKHKMKAIASIINHTLLASTACLSAGIPLSHAEEIEVRDGQVVNLENATYDTLFVVDEHTRLIGKNINVITPGNERDEGVGVSNGAYLELTDSFIKTTGDEVDGVLAYGATTTPSAVLNNVNIETSGETALGVFALDNSAITLRDGSVKTTGAYSVGIFSMGINAQLDANGLLIETSGDDAPGVRADNKGIATLDGVSIQTQGVRSRGIEVSDSGSTLSSTDVNITTHGNDAYGVLAENKGSVSVTGGTIKTTGKKGHGIATQNANTAVQARNVTIETSGDGALGINVTKDSKVDAQGGSIATGGIESHGLAADSVNSRLTAGNIDITTSGANAYGVLSQNAAQVALQGGKINTTGAGGVGVAIRYKDSSAQTADVNIETAGDNAYGIAAIEGAKANVSGGSINTRGTEGYGITAQDSGSTITARQVSIETAGLMARGVTASNAELTLQDSNITTSGEQAYAAAVFDSGRVALSGVKINTTGRQGFGLGVTDAGSSLTAENTTIETNGEFATGAIASGKSSLNLTNSSIKASGDTAYGVAVSGSSTLNAAQTTIQTQGQGGHTLLVFRNGSAEANTIHITGGSLNSASGDTLYAAGALLDISLDGVTDQHAGSGVLIRAINDAASNVGNVNFSAKDSTLTGDVIAGGNNTVALSMDNTRYTGAINNGTSLALANASTWNITGDSSVSQSVNNSGTIAFSAPSDGHFKTLTVGNYTGNGGTIAFNSALAGDDSATDRLVITGDSAGSTSVRVNNLGGKGAQTIEGIALISVGGVSDGVFTKSGRIAAGAYDYDLQKKNNNWYLTSNYVEPEKPADPVVPVDPGKPQDPVNPPANVPPAESEKPADPVSPVNPDAPSESVTPTNPEKPVEPVTPAEPEKPADPAKPAQPGAGAGGSGSAGPAKHIYRPESGSYAANLMAANTMFNLSLHDRLGETQYTDVLTGEQNVTSLWLRNEGGHQRSKMADGQNKTQANRYVVQLGGDLAQWTTSGRDRYHLGLMAGYANQKSHTHSTVTGYRSRGQIDGYSTGLYGTWYANEADKSGLYVDSWLQYSWFKNKVNGDALPAEKYKSRGFTVSLESGYSFLLGETRTAADMINSWWVQPQAQMIWMGVKDKKHTEDNGTRVSGKGQNNIQTRLGVKAYMQGHSTLDEGKGRTFQPFIATSWIHNTKKFGVTMDGVTARMEGTRNIAEIKTGIEGQLSSSVNLWGSVAQQIGDEKYSDTQAAVGFKYLF
ncbi:autotransporter outer membrane beta-barrel domain-containing protein [Pluralibacter gergoviae]